MVAHGAIRWAATSPNLNTLDFFIFIRNYRDNVYLTPPGTQKELRKWIVQVCQEKTRNFLLNAKVGISKRYRQLLQQH
jgi:REP element-mobilizing transposase RayT